MGYFPSKVFSFKTKYHRLNLGPVLSSTSRGSPFGSRKLQQTHATLKGNASKTQGELCFRYSSPVSETIWIFFSSWTEKKLLNYFLYRRLNLYSRSLDEINQYETFLLKEYFIDHLTKHLRVHRYNCFIERWVDTFRRIQQIWYFSDRTFERSCLRSIRLFVSLDEKRNSSLGEQKSDISLLFKGQDGTIRTKLIQPNVTQGWQSQYPCI